MKKVYLPVVLAITALIFFSFFNLGFHIKNNGSPGGNTGAPGEWGGRTCANPACHSGSASFQAGMISSDIPATGFIPGDTYMISGTVSETGRTKYGFEISPQDSSGNLLGSLSVINSVETKFTNQGKSITHTAGGNTAPGGSKTWSFSWTAPSDGTDFVTFWGAFNAANRDNTSSGDIIYRSLLSVEKDTSIISALRKEDLAKIYIYPNPFIHELTVSIPEKLEERATILISDLKGNSILRQKTTIGLSKLQLDLSQLRQGQYIIRIEKKNGILLVSKRIIKTEQSVF